MDEIISWLKCQSLETTRWRKVCVIIARCCNIPTSLFNKWAMGSKIKQVQRGLIDSHAVPSAKQGTILPTTSQSPSPSPLCSYACLLTLQAKEVITERKLLPCAIFACLVCLLKPFTDAPQSKLALRCYPKEEEAVLSTGWVAAKTEDISGSCFGWHLASTVSIGARGGWDLPGSHCGPPDAYTVFLFLKPLSSKCEPGSIKNVRSRHQSKSRQTSKWLLNIIKGTKC